MSSARSITESANPPRAVYLDYPLGHTSGKPDDRNNQLDIMRATLAAFETIDSPGTIVDLLFEWTPDDSWKDRVMRPSPKKEPGEGQKAGPKQAGAKEDSHSDDRVARFDTPQYQTEDDASSADPNCPTCVFLTDNR